MGLLLCTLDVCCFVKSVTIKKSSLNIKLDPNRDYSARDELVRWERYIKDNVESETFKMRGSLAYEKYKEEEDKYCSC